jgi:GDP/UDP-N,N'-diacetylbacillosamine 2-epimerase (hydrolysing)
MLIRKISVTTGSRSEYGILRPILKKISTSKTLELYLIVTGMHNSKKFGLTINEIKKDGFKIYKKIDMLPKNDSNYSMAIALSNGIKSFANTFKILKPDINLILGDRDEMLASSLAAYHMNIVNAHIHGGDRTQGGIDEYTRHAITKISNIHFPATLKSHKRIIKMGENKNNIFLVGSPSIDEIKNNNILNRKQLEKKYKIKFSGDELLLLYHPVTTEANKTEKQISIILDVIKKLNKLTIAIAPNSDAGNKVIFSEYEKFSKKYDNFKMFKSVPRTDYLGFLKYSGALVGNSSSGIIEASYFQIPVVNIGIRQNGREKGKNVIDLIKLNPTSLHKSLVRALNMKKFSKIHNQSLYGDGNSSKKIVDILEKIKLDTKLIQKQISY